MNEDNFEYTEDLNAQAENGDQDAQFAIAMCFDHGYGIVKDPFEAIPWYKKAAEQGHPDALFRLGELYGDNEQKDQAKSWYLKAAKKGHREAMYTLGGFFSTDNSSKEDMEQAQHWYSEAAQQ